MSSTIRTHGSVTANGKGGYMVTFEIDGFGDREAAVIVNRELAAVIHAYFTDQIGGETIDAGEGTPPWKVKQ